MVPHLFVVDSAWRIFLLILLNIRESIKTTIFEFAEILDRTCQLGFYECDPPKFALLTRYHDISCST